MLHYILVSYWGKKVSCLPDSHSFVSDLSVCLFFWKCLFYFIFFVLLYWNSIGLFLNACLFRSSCFASHDFPLRIYYLFKNNYILSLLYICFSKNSYQLVSRPSRLILCVSRLFCPSFCPIMFLQYLGHFLYLPFNSYFAYFNFSNQNFFLMLGSFWSMLFVLFYAISSSLVLGILM